VTGVAAEVRAIVLDQLAYALEQSGRARETVSDETDFFAEQLIDSFGMLELFLALEERFAVTIYFESLDADDLTVVGPFCAYVERLVVARPADAVGA
jgi:acyl carrier protein